MQHRTATINSNPLSAEVSESYTVEQLVATMKGNATFKIPPIYEDVDTKGVTRLNISAGMALRHLVEMIRKGVDSAHPMIYLESAGMKPKVFLTPNKVVVEGEIGELKVLSGTVIPKDSHAESVVLSSVVADVMAISHRKGKGDVGIDQVFQDGQYEKMLNLKVPFDAKLIQDWGTVPTFNADNMYKFFMEKKNAGKALQYSVKLAQNLYPHQVTALNEYEANYIKNINKAIKPVKLTAWKPKYFVPRNEREVWTILGGHRKHRGVDGKGTSALFAGYYCYGMSRSLDKILWNVADIMTMLKSCKVNYVVINSIGHKISQSVVNSLVANGVVILTDEDSLPSTAETAAKMNLKDNEDVPPGVYRNDHTQRSVVYVASRLYDVPDVKLRTGAITWKMSDQDCISTLKRWIQENENRKVTAFRHLYLREALREFTDYLIPSMHAHAGHVIMCTQPVKMGITLDLLFTRMSQANAFKTQFPFGHVAYAKFDPYRPESFDKGIYIVREKTTLKEDLISGMVLQEIGGIEEQDLEFKAIAAVIPDNWTLPMKPEVPAGLPDRLVVTTVVHAVPTAQPPPDPPQNLEGAEDQGEPFDMDKMGTLQDDNL